MCMSENNETFDQLNVMPKGKCGTYFWLHAIIACIILLIYSKKCKKAQQMFISLFFVCIAFSHIYRILYNDENIHLKHEMLLLEDALIFIDVKEKGEIEIYITAVNVGKRENE